MPQIKANGVMLEFASCGDAAAPALLLISGLGTQMIRWPSALIEGLVDQGLRVIIYDNRDVGLSHKFEAAGLPNLGAVVKAITTGQPAAIAYGLPDMAADAAGLLEALGVKAAHIVGVSMGGMIAQLVAANHPDKTLSLTSIMSSTGDPSLPRATPEAIATLNTPAANPATDLEGYLDHAVRSAQVNGSPAYPTAPDQLRARAAAYVARCYYPPGFARQYAAVMACPSRRAKCATITAPTLVIHGDADPLVPVDAGRDTAAHIPGAQLMIIPGMGHDLPQALIPTFVKAISDTAARVA